METLLERIPSLDTIVSSLDPVVLVGGVPGLLIVVGLWRRDIGVLTLGAVALAVVLVLMYISGAFGGSTWIPTRLL
ncbi:MAG: hypothetical protein ACYC1C_10995 [Chloroflexota bacterium]